MAGVRAMVDLGIDHVPNEYLTSICKGITIKAPNNLPIIDLSGIDSDDLKRKSAAEEIHLACQKWGFFQVLCNCFSQVIGQDIIKMVHYFFNLLAKEMMVYYSIDIYKSFKFSTGSTSYRYLKPKILIQSKPQRTHCRPAVHEDDVPECIPNYKKITSNYAKAVDKLARKLLRIIAQNLGLDWQILERHLDPPKQTMKMTYYPQCPCPDQAIGIGCHADPGTITVLQQELGVEGLEVNYNGQWIPVKPVEGALVINVADMLQVKVLVNTKKPRVSIASFYGPTDDKHIAPLEELLGDNPPMFKACLFREYMDSFYKNHLGTRNIETLRILNN
ncbi:2-oxoacid-dependent dioxygenase [Selaginella moellendorffii]|uniref:2-oxoacid-dependent dioxygenase n=1 Tax=Selaginella moellendorffii TaxID=88036 RepID=D8RTI4_SELML|nr:2-oxoacid-dependent dioxygenase [Selaginella moellendorffii]